MCQMFGMIAGAVQGSMQAQLQNAQNYGQFTIQSAQADANNTLSQDQADNNNKIREANNSFEAAQASLSNTQRSISNQNRAIALGAQSNAQAMNAARAQDAMMRGDIEQQIAASQQLGAIRADAAARGVGGTSADIMRKTMQGTTARLTTMQTIRGAQMSFDQVMAAAGVRSALITSQDYGQTVANMNYQKSIPQTFLAPMRMPDITPAQGALMGSVGGGGFQQFNQGSMGGGTVGGGYSGTVGNTPNYSSQSIMSGVNSFNSSWGSSSGNSGSNYGVGNNSYGFTLDGGSGSGSSGSDAFSFSLD